jgi:shikimate dehydrogenase
MTIRGTTEIVAHIGYPADGFRSPLIYNPYFEHAGIDAVVVPMSCRPDRFPAFLAAVFTLTNIRGAIIAMPHKVAAAERLDEASPAVRIAGSCNAVRRAGDGRLQGDLFDGEGFVRALRRNGCRIDGARALVVGTGGVGSAIAASLAGAGAHAIALFDKRAVSAAALADRLVAHYPGLELSTGRDDPSGFGIVVNATPLGTNENDPLPVDPERIEDGAFVGDVVLSRATPLVRAADARGFTTVRGSDMLFEQIPDYLEFFGFATTTPEHLRRLAHDEA